MQANSLEVVILSRLVNVNAMGIRWACVPRWPHLPDNGEAPCVQLDETLEEVHQVNERGSNGRASQGVSPASETSRSPSLKKATIGIGLYLFPLNSHFLLYARCPLWILTCDKLLGRDKLEVV